MKTINLQDIKPKIDYGKTYSPIINTIRFIFLIRLTVSRKFDMRLINLITVYE